MLREVCQKTNQAILDSLFPITCLGCGFENVWICKDCLKSIRVKKEHLCPVCEKVKTPQGKTCLKCKRKNSIDGLISCCDFNNQNQLVKKSIYAFKYRFIENLGNPLGELLCSAVIKNELPLPDIIIPIPLHPKRLRWRGFNQSEILSTNLSEKLTPGMEIPIEIETLKRTRNTCSQMKIKNHKIRQENITNAFKVEDRKKVKGKHILLIDDIATTGSTLFECAKELKKAGAKKVFGLIIARQG